MCNPKLTSQCTRFVPHEYYFLNFCLIYSIVGGCFGEQVIEQKGLDIVRRDWSSLSKDIGNYCLDQILSGRYTPVVNCSLRFIWFLMHLCQIIF
jgi:hypothetical protein